MDRSPNFCFHAGEIALQDKAGAAEKLTAVGPQLLRDFFTQQHQSFYPLLPFLLIGSMDEEGWPCASVLAGEPGFVHTPNEYSLRIDAPVSTDDPLAQNLRNGAPLGILGLQPHTRRRNRVNGTVFDCGTSGFSLNVHLSFGNCPKYIVARTASHCADHRQPPIAVRRSTGLDDTARILIANADTFFIASAHPEALMVADRAHGVDISHRGGPSGFLKVEGDALYIPDYRGNFFFNTLGNLSLHPRAGLLFIDYTTGDLLHLSATTEILHESSLTEQFPGAQRLLKMTVRETLWRPQALANLHWEPPPPQPEGAS